MSISISKRKDYSVSMYQARYAISAIVEYLDTVTIKENSKFHNTTLSDDMVFTK